jgi:fused signal recognition particle receptor
MITWFKRKRQAEMDEACSESDGRPAGEDAISPETAAAPGEDDPGAGKEAGELPRGSGSRSEAFPDVVPDDGDPEEEVPVAEDGAGERGELLRRGHFFPKLRERLQKTRERLADRVDRLVLGKKHIDDELLEELEEILITSDLGISATRFLLEQVSERVRRNELKDPARLQEELRSAVARLLQVPAPPWDPAAARPFVILVVGVNGVGKTTTIGKLAHRLKGEGFQPLLVAGDTFRAAAIEQLVLWGERIGAPVVRQKHGADPSAVAFDALEAATSRDVDVVIVDTAGRMHTKVNLMEEIKKVHRVIQKKMPGAPHEILLVLDATTGQNALSQARLFKDTVGVSGLVLTKLDGTAKGGVIVPVCHELQLPVRFIGVGEKVEDLRPFDPEEFARAIV